VTLGDDAVSRIVSMRLPAPTNGKDNVNGAGNGAGNGKHAAEELAETAPT
jgi:hypothetical protein